MSGHVNLKDTVLEISGVNPRKCMQCGKCSGTCPSFDEMEYHPHQFVAMVRKGQIEKLARSQSIYKCLSCFACVERCPRGVEPAKLVEAIRLIKIRQKRFYCRIIEPQIFRITFQIVFRPFNQRRLSEMSERRITDIVHQTGIFNDGRNLNGIFRAYLSLGT